MGRSYHTGSQPPVNHHLGSFNQPLEDALTLLTGTMMRLCIGTYQLTKAIDPSRPVNGIAGDVHFMSDIWSIRNYESDAMRFAQHLKPNNRMAFYNNQPFFHRRIRRYTLDRIYQTG